MLRNDILHSTNLYSTIELIIGRGWGQGYILKIYSRGLLIYRTKVIIPSNPNDAKDLLISSIRSQSVIFIEHRWLHEMKGKVEKHSLKKLNRLADVK